MLYRRLPRGQEDLSILGFGCMRLPTRGPRIDEEAAERLVRDAVERGVNYLDTAQPYHGGASETFVGKLLASGLRDKVRVATKLPHWLVDRPGDMDTIFRGQLEKLQSEHVDYYLVHSLDGKSWGNMATRGVREFLERAKKDGRIHHAGFSFHGAPRDFAPIVDAYDWDFCLIQYNFMDEQNQAGTAGLEYAASKGLGVMVMEPLRGGNLAGPPPPTVQALLKKAPVERTPVDWALRWIWNRPEVTLLLSGMNQAAHVEENCRLASEAEAGSMSDAELSFVAELAEAYRDAQMVPCTGCGYCLPCPAKVNIPSAFEAYNRARSFGDRSVGFFYMARCGGVMGKETAWASQCTACHACESKCPQGIAIADRMKEASAHLDGFGMRCMARIARMFMAAQRWWTVGRKRKPDEGAKG